MTVQPPVAERVKMWTFPSESFSRFPRVSIGFRLEIQPCSLLPPTAVNTRVVKNSPLYEPNRCMPRPCHLILNEFCTKFFTVNYSESMLAAGIPSNFEQLVHHAQQGDVEDCLRCLVCRAKAPMTNLVVPAGITSRIFSRPASDRA